MKKVFEYLRKYFFITFLLTLGILVYAIVKMHCDDNMPPITIKYLFQILIGYILIMAALIPLVAYIDLLIVKAAQSLFSDFKHADRAGKITIIVVMVILLLRKIVSLTR